MKNKKNKNKTSSVIVIFIIIIVLGIVVYANRGKVIGMNNVSRTVFSFETGQQFRFESHKNNILALNSDGVICIAQNGRQPWNITQQISNPRIQNEEGYTILYEAGSKEISAYNNGAKMWQHVMEQPIITAKINAKGYAAVVSYEIGYKGKIDILNSNGQIIYKWQLGENYVVDVDVSPDCKFFAAVTLSPNNAKVTSKISVVDIDGEKVMGETVREDSLIFLVKYQTGGSLTALGDNELVGISPKGEKKWEINFGGRALQKYIIPYNTSCVLTFAGSRNNSIVEIYNREGHKTGEYISESEIKAIDISVNEVVLAEKRNIIKTNLKGRVTLQTEMQKEIRDLMLLLHGNIAVVGSNSVEIIKL